jgi:hypothetical protein
MPFSARSRGDTILLQFHRASSPLGDPLGVGSRLVSSSDENPEVFSFEQEIVRPNLVAYVP